MNIRKPLLKLAMAIAKNMSTKPYTVIVEGNIGSGKTTFLNYLKKYKDICVLDEPVDIWRNCAGHNLLDLMYKNPNKWGFTFQSYVQLSMLELHLKETTKPVKLIERSLYSARYCFVEKLIKDGAIEAASASVLDEYFKWMTECTDMHVDLIVYLRTTPDVVYQRVLERKRKEEKYVPFDYVKDLHDYHENWLIKKITGTQPAPVFVINGDLDKESIQEEFQKYESNILNKLAKEQ